MKNRLALIPLLATILLCLHCAESNYPQLINKEVDVILEKHAQAMGGKEKWRQLQSYRKVIDHSKGFKLTVTCLMPDKVKLHFQKEGLDLLRAYDGEYGYSVRNGQLMPMKKNDVVEMEEEPRYYSELMFAKDDGGKVQLLGKETIDEISCYKLLVKKLYAGEHTYWVNTETYLIEQTGEYIETEPLKGIYYKTRLMDYQTIDGYRFPFRQALIQHDGPPVESRVAKMEIDVDLEASDFSYHPNSTENLIRYWKDRYQDDRLHAFTFEQETIRFKDGVPSDTSIWYEAVQYPDKFRIDLGPKANRNSNLWRNDSIYVQRKGEIVHQGAEVRSSIIMEGALYVIPPDSTLAKLKAVNLDPALFDTASYEGTLAYIIGAKKGDLQSPQIWLDAERRILVRSISKSKKGALLEGRYGEFKQLWGHWVESYIEFFRDGELMQVEWYKNIDVHPELSPKVFDPKGFQNHYWY